MSNDVLLFMKKFWYLVPLAPNMHSKILYVGSFVLCESSNVGTFFKKLSTVSSVVLLAKTVFLCPKFIVLTMLLA